MIADRTNVSTATIKKSDSKFVVDAAKCIDIAKFTQGMIESLSDSQLGQVFSFTSKLMDEENNPYKPVSKEQILRDVRASKKEFESGDSEDALEAVGDIKAEFGL